MTNENRNRVQSGVPTGGQFAAEQHAEAGITLTVPAPLDAAARGVVGDLVRAMRHIEVGSWQRRMEKGGGHLRPEPPMPEVLVELTRRAESFETLPRDEQDFVLDQLKIPGASHLLEPGQKLGTDDIRVADGVEENAENLGLALATQKIVANAGLPGIITLTRAGQGTTAFTIQAGGTEHRLDVGLRSFTISADTDESGGHLVSDWMHRATIRSSGSTVFDPYMSDVIGRHFDAHRETAVMMDVVAASSFREAGDVLGELNRRSRRAELRTDGAGFALDVSGDEPAMFTEDGEKLHPSMVTGFLNHMAAKTGHADGAAFASDLREVFRETDRRLVR